MPFLFLKAYCQLLRFERLIARGKFERVHTTVRNCPIGISPAAEDVAKSICTAIDMVCIWYWKEVFCLQRSAATTCLLRRHGVPAQMVIGAQPLPFKAHAWVEIGGRVVNDKPYMREMYAVLDEC